jgi:hypothetical protein
MRVHGNSVGAPVKAAVSRLSSLRVATMLDRDELIGEYVAAKTAFTCSHIQVVSR